MAKETAFFSFRHGKRQEMALIHPRVHKKDLTQYFFMLFYFLEFYFHYQSQSNKALLTSAIEVVLKVGKINLYFWFSGSSNWSTRRNIDPHWKEVLIRTSKCQRLQNPQGTGKNSQAEDGNDQQQGRGLGSKRSNGLWVSDERRFVSLLIH